MRGHSAEKRQGFTAVSYSIPRNILLPRSSMQISCPQCDSCSYKTPQRTLKAALNQAMVTARTFDIHAATGSAGRDHPFAPSIERVGHRSPEHPSTPLIAGESDTIRLAHAIAVVQACCRQLPFGGDNDSWLHGWQGQFHNRQVAAIYIAQPQGAAIHATHLDGCVLVGQVLVLVEHKPRDAEWAACAWLTRDGACEQLPLRHTRMMMMYKHTHRAEGFSPRAHRMLQHLERCPNLPQNLAGIPAVLDQELAMPGVVRGDLTVNLLM